MPMFLFTFILAEKRKYKNYCDFLLRSSHSRLCLYDIDSIYAVESEIHAVRVAKEFFEYFLVS